MKPTIEIIIAPTGETAIDAVGFKGADCEKATKFLEEALGVIGGRTPKADYFEVSSGSQNPQRIAQPGRDFRLGPELRGRHGRDVLREKEERPRQHNNVAW